MNTLRTPAVGLSLAGLLLASASLASAQSTWFGGDGQYLDGANWDPAGVPDTNSGGTAVINSGNVTYTPGGDLHVHNGGTLRINGGSWTQVGGDAWIQLAGGNLVVAGGTFNQGTAGNTIRDADSTITVSSGTANFNGEFANAGLLDVSGGNVSFGSHLIAASGTISISGGNVAIGGELKGSGTGFVMSGGTLSTSLIAFDGGVAAFTLSGGLINVAGNFTDGIFSVEADSHINFTVGSTGQIHFASVSTTAAANLLAGKIRIDGTIDASAFEIISDGAAGSIVRLEGYIIPEPSSFAALFGLAALGFAAAGRRRRD